MRKNIIILWHNGGELANQLWLFISVYAYALEEGCALENFSFFEYSRYFNIPLRSSLVKILFFWPFSGIEFFVPKRLHRLLVLCFRRYYRTFIQVVKWLRQGKVLTISADAPIPCYLPPSAEG